MKLQGSPDTKLNHTTLIFAPNLAMIEWNVTNLHRIPDNHTNSFKFSTFTAFIHQFCQPDSIACGYEDYRDHLQLSK